MAEINSNWDAPGGFTPSMHHDDLAGFWTRFIAHIADGLNTMLIVLPFSFVSSAVSDSGNKSMSEMITFLGAAAAVFMLAKWTGERGGSPLRVRYGALVVDAHDGSFIGFRRAFFRILMSYVSQFVLLLGYFWMLWSPNKQTWHDKVANSVVVKR